MTRHTWWLLLLAAIQAAGQQSIGARVSVAATSDQVLVVVLDASADARVGEAGTYSALRFSGPAAENGGGRARVTLEARTASGVTILGETIAGWAGETAEVRLTSTADGRYLAYVNGEMVFAVRNPGVLPGRPSHVSELPYAAEVVAGYDDLEPAAVAVRVAAYANEVWLKWEASTAADVWRYEVSRDGEPIGRTAEACYVDGSAGPGEHSYEVRAVDYTGKTGRRRASRWRPFPVSCKGRRRCGRRGRLRGRRRFRPGSQAGGG